jgi:hypothetical protein
MSRYGRSKTRSSSKRLNKMSSEEMYFSRYGSLFKIKRIVENPIFFRYEKLSWEDSKNITTDFPKNDYGIMVSKAGSFGDHATEPAADDTSPRGNETDHVK